MPIPPYGSHADPTLILPIKAICLAQCLYLISLGRYNATHVRRLSHVELILIKTIAT